MRRSFEFLQSVLDSISEHIVVINGDGDIQFVNQSWTAFGEKNQSADHNWYGINYLDECDKAAKMGDEFGQEAGDGIRRVINQQSPFFYFEYPCHSADEKRWFMMRVTSFHDGEETYYVISHQNITERKLAEEYVHNQAKVDGLTNIPNRRAFDEFLQKEWKRCMRLRKELSMAIIDLDYFKCINDTYGHLAGDECLVKIASLFVNFAQRPSDFYARFGGEEFVIVWGDMGLTQATSLCRGLSSKISSLQIPNKQSPEHPYLTVSIGVTTMVPPLGSQEIDIVKKADQLLYLAKKNGRARIEAAHADKVLDYTRN